MLILDQVIHVCYFQFSQQNLQGSKDCYCFFLHMCMFASMQERDRERKKGKEGRREGGRERDRERCFCTSADRGHGNALGVLLFHFFLSFLEKGSLNLGSAVFSNAGWRSGQVSVIFLLAPCHVSAGLQMRRAMFSFIGCWESNLRSQACASRSFMQ